MIQFDQIQINLKSDPIDVDSGPVRFSWRYVSDEMDVRQNSYQIRVNDVRDNRTVWDSGVCTSSQAETTWNGDGLSSDQRYTWTLRCETSSANGNTFVTARGNFETGLFDECDWHGCWIGEEREKPWHTGSSTKTAITVGTSTGISRRIAAAPRP